MLRFPVIVDGTDAVVSVADGDVTLGDVLATQRNDDALVASTDVVVGRRTLPADTAFVDARVRPGDAIGGECVGVPTPLGGRWGVHVLAGVDAGRIVEIESNGSPVTVGRGDQMNVRIQSNGVSVHHCTVVVAADVITVIDAGSRNGTVVRQHRVTAPIVVGPGEVIRCGPSAFSVRRLLPEDAPRSVAQQLDTATTGPVPFYRSPIDLPPSPGPEVAAPAAAR